MSWKNVKEHYQIKHAVSITEKGICIGSPYIHDIIVIGLDGVIKKRYDSESNSELNRYQKEFDADLPTLKKLVTTPDTFLKSIPIYTADGGKILEKRCEAIGWPNITHDGEMMYENVFFLTAAAAARKAMADANAGLEWRQDKIKNLKTEIAEIEAYIALLKTNRAQLETDYPT